MKTIKMMVAAAIMVAGLTVTSYGQTAKTKDPAKKEAHEAREAKAKDGKADKMKAKEQDKDKANKPKDKPKAKAKKKPVKK